MASEQNKFYRGWENLVKKLCNLFYTTSIKQRLKSDRNIKCYILHHLQCEAVHLTSNIQENKTRYGKLPHKHVCIYSIVHCPTYPRVACPRVPSGKSMNRVAIHIDEIGQKGRIARYCKKFLQINFVGSQLGTRDNCRDNGTLFLGRKMWGNCLVTLHIVIALLLSTLWQLRVIALLLSTLWQLGVIALLLSTLWHLKMFRVLQIYRSPNTLSGIKEIATSPTPQIIL